MFLDWDQKYEKAIDCDLEWDDVDDVTETELQEEESEHEGDVAIEHHHSSDSLTGDDISNTDGGQNRRPPCWMWDYVTGEELSEEDNKAYLIISGMDDPMHFEDAVKTEKWRRAMDEEMEAIERNNTWELTELPQ
ncbi:hypothetical protein V6N12_016137 [Hibiscus sabdariffa]|uniref:Copia-type polyprotein n=1 Tax=Hibiscus sabdariffa TaxID=183260 RepID=A0ABR2CAR6_9ROSI